MLMFLKKTDREIDKVRKIAAVKRSNFSVKFDFPYVNMTC